MQSKAYFRVGSGSSNGRRNKQNIEDNGREAGEHNELIYLVTPGHWRDLLVLPDLYSA
jgi:hypothetical protein